MRWLEKVSAFLNQLFTRVAGFALVAMMVLSVGNIILRLVYVPFGATAEVVGWLSAVAVALVLGHTQINRGHVAMDILVKKFSPEVRKIVESVGLLLSAVLFSVTAWKLGAYAVRLQEIGVLSESLGVAFYPVVFLVALGFVCLFLVLLVDFVKTVAGVAD